MDFLFTLFGESVAVVTFVALIRLTLLVMFAVLGIIFLSKVPVLLEDIAVSLLLLYKGNKNPKPTGKVPYIPKEMLDSDDDV